MIKKLPRLVPSCPLPERYQLYFPVKLPEPHEPGALPETCDSRGRRGMGWHVDLGKNFADRGLNGSRTLENTPDGAVRSHGLWGFLGGGALYRP